MSIDTARRRRRWWIVATLALMVAYIPANAVNLFGGPILAAAFVAATNAGHWRGWLAARAEQPEGSDR